MPDYSKADLPEIRDYPDIFQCPDPILAAMAVTGDKEPQAWCYWWKLLDQARRGLGQEVAGKRFLRCVADLWGEMKSDRIAKPGAVLNGKLKGAFPSAR